MNQGSIIVLARSDIDQNNDNNNYYININNNKSKSNKPCPDPNSLNSKALVPNHTDYVLEMDEQPH